MIKPKKTRIPHSQGQAYKLTFWKKNPQVKLKLKKKMWKLKQKNGKTQANKLNFRHFPSKNILVYANTVITFESLCVCTFHIINNLTWFSQITQAQNLIFLANTFCPLAETWSNFQAWCTHNFWKLAHFYTWLRGTKGCFWPAGESSSSTWLTSDTLLSADARWYLAGLSWDEVDFFTFPLNEFWRGREFRRWRLWVLFRIPVGAGGGSGCTICGLKIRVTIV